ncbi:hypothetical protein BDV95DRAFT_149651 [Massariosphaeria phaeospora]|uniref:Rhodopsin domain-containing protein n=1 Tax=Massariosphaeria phaeospora TaxID=100035 RepID=A0A7C8ILV2_9PLEO|nr:hypothetical protein BDV95DRAFT_149651 [Massariosphaeria phaeospora]
MFIRPGFVVVIVGCTLTSLSTIIVTLRYYCRYFLMGSVGATDHLMLTALILTWGNTVLNYYQDDMSRLTRPSAFKDPVSCHSSSFVIMSSSLTYFQDKRPQSETAVRGTLITWYVYRMSYGVALCFVKLSILFFYRAIASHATFRRLVYVTITFVCLYTVGITIAGAFQCETPSASWDTTSYLSQFDGKPGRTKPKVKCYNPNMLWTFAAAANLFTDIVILLLPVPTLLALRVPMSKRLALIGIFSVGIMAIIASCVRMWVMALWSESPQNAARFGTDLLLWGQVETNSGIISASVPFLRLIFRSRHKEAEEMRVVTPPKHTPTDNKPLKVDTLANFSGPDHGPNGSPVWQPFITVPVSLSSGSRGSGMLESQGPVEPHTTV